MLLPWSTLLCVSILAGAFAVTTLNVIIVGGFIGRSTIIHADLDKLKGRKISKNIIACNAVLAFIFLILLVLYAGSFGWKSYSSYATSKGCDLSGSAETVPEA